MQSILSLRVTGVALATVLILALLAAWRADRRDRVQLAADLDSANQALTQATVRQHAREAQLQQALAAIALQKRTIITPAQILRELPKQIPLPAPITPPPSKDFASELSKSPPVAHDRSAQTTTSTDQVQLPLADLKPLYDFALDCRTCQAKLAAAQGDLADERAKTAVLTKERDTAVRAAKGGTALRRAARAAKWFLLGAAAGIIATQAAK